MDLLYELWLHDACGFDPKKVDKCIYMFENAYNAFHSKPFSAKRLAGFGLSGFLSTVKNLETAERILADCKEKDIRIITIEDDEYPHLLRECYLPPRLLFVKGSLTNFNDYLPISIVGTRTPTEQGKIIAKNLSSNLVKYGKILIVSGMADGIDKQAHLGALENNAPTVAILAGGVDIIYPKSNRTLYNKILKNGAIISERPPETVGKSFFYQQRNRIIAGMSYGSVIVEAKYKSGCRITSNHAYNNNRDVFAVPSSPLSSGSQLPSKLLKEGAFLVENEKDIINQYIDVYPEYFYTENNTNKTENKPLSYENLSNDEMLIINHIIKNGGIGNAEIMAAEIDLPIGKLNGLLVMLCLKDILIEQSQNEYILKEA